VTGFHSTIESPGFGKPRGAADQHHDRDQRGNGDEPPTDGAGDARSGARKYRSSKLRLNEFARHLIVRPFPRASRGKLKRAAHFRYMTIRTRKFFGTIALLVLVVVWSFDGNDLWRRRRGLRIPGCCRQIFYVVAGIGWVLPAMPIISWMARPG